MITSTAGLSLPINPLPPRVMHIDLNGAFAMTEQQANPLLRHRPVGVTNRLNDWAICITSSYEAKSRGIGLGTRYREAKVIAPDFVMLESDPAKYQYVHRTLRRIFESYSPLSYMKSVDEGIIDFTGMDGILKGRPLEDIALEIKQRVATEIGDYMTLNIGISYNRWLAKVAASFNKPNGLLTIDASNLEAIYTVMDLVELPYIKKRWQVRLNQAGIYTPLDFYQAPYWLLFRRVFKSVLGHHWYLKLRGYETETEFGIKSVGRNYVLEHRTADFNELALLMHKASVKIARRLRKNDLAARGLALSLRFARSPYEKAQWGWFGRNMWKAPAWRGDQLYERSLHLLSQGHQGYIVTHFSLTSYGLGPNQAFNQPPLFESEVRRDYLEKAVHAVNDRYGELTVQPASVAASKNPMKDKIPFGTIRYFD